jgi:hypothetical protein
MYRTDDGGRTRQTRNKGIRVTLRPGTGAASRPDEISFTAALQNVNAFLQRGYQAATPEDARALWDVMIVSIGWKRVGNRPGRQEPRAVKRRPKKFDKLTTTRQEARRRLRQGHKEGATQDATRG